MKKKLITVLILAAMLMLGAAVHASAASGGNAEQYKYRITVYSGQQGHFTCDDAAYGGTVWSREFAPGERVEIYLNETLGFVLDNDRYYVRGLRVAGHDNDENTGLQSLNFSASRDVSYEIAYGLKGSLVAYTVKYVDEDGNKLIPTDTFYGMPGDKPVVSYRYIEGFKPMMYTIKGVLSEDESRNEFQFVYRELVSEDYKLRRGSSDTTVVVSDDIEITAEEADEEAEEEVDEIDDDTKGDSGSSGSGGSFSDFIQNLFDLEDGPIPKAIRYAKENPVKFALCYALPIAAGICLIVFMIRRRKRSGQKH